MFNHTLTAQSIRTGVMLLDKPFHADKPELAERVALKIACQELPFNDTFRIIVYKLDEAGRKHQISRWCVS